MEYKCILIYYNKFYYWTYLAISKADFNTLKINSKPRKLKPLFIIHIIIKEEIQIKNKMSFLKKLKL